MTLIRSVAFAALTSVLALPAFAQVTTGDRFTPRSDDPLHQTFLRLHIGNTDLEQRDQPTQELVRSDGVGWRATAGFNIEGFFRDNSSPDRSAGFFTLSYVNQDADVKSVTNTGGTTFATTGNARHNGILIGFEGSTILGDFGPTARGGDISPLSGPLINVFAGLSAGVGNTSFDAFGGGFTRNETGTMFLAEVGASIEVSAGVNVGVGFAHSQFRGDLIRTEANQLTGFIQFGF